MTGESLGDKNLKEILLSFLVQPRYGDFPLAYCVLLCFGDLLFSVKEIVGVDLRKRGGRRDQKEQRKRTLSLGYIVCEKNLFPIKKYYPSNSSPESRMISKDVTKPHKPECKRKCSQG